MKRKLFKKISLGALLIAALGINTMTAQTGAALNFDGVNDRVDLGTAITTSISNTNKITAEAWVNPSSLSTAGVIVGNYNTIFNSSMQFLLRINGSTYEFWIGNATPTGFTNCSTVAGTATLGVWQHVAGTWDGSVARVYVNGVQTATAAITYTSMGSFANPVWIGSENTNPLEKFNGSIDEVRIWNIVRTQAEIQNTRNCEINGATPNLLGNYHFNQGIASGSNTSVTTAIDDSGNNITGTLTAMTLTGTTSNWIAPGGVTSGVSCNGAALNFDGTSDVVNCGSAITTSLIGSNVLTAEAWIRPESTTGVRNIIGNHQFSLSQFTLRQIGTQLNAMLGFGTYTLLTAPNTLSINVWQHIAMVFNGTSLTAYINGVNAGSTTFPSYTLNTSSDNITIGSNNFNEHFDGNIDEVRVWKRALCQGELQNSMMGQLSLPQSNLIGYYQFNQGLAAGSNTSITSLNALAGPTGTLQTFALTSGTLSNWVSPGGVSSNSTVSAFVSPTLSIASPTAICLGSSTTLTASGVNSYTWTSGPTTASFAVTPTVTTTYSVVGTATNGCLTNITTRTINVNPIPTVAVNNGTICSGSTFTIVPSGANTYTIQGGSASVTPTTNSTYTVVGTSTAGCVSANTATSNVTVNTLPTVSAASSNTNFICVGSTATLTAAGANTYVWNTTATTAVIAVSPTTTTNYTVTGTDANGCSANVVLTQSVSTCTGIDNLSLNISNLSFQVYPNPSNGIFNVHVENTATIEITDVLGRVILTDKVNAGNYQLNLGNNVNGVYFVKATVNGKTKTVKIVKE